MAELAGLEREIKAQLAKVGLNGDSSNDLSRLFK
jgi:hypothetical protein